MNTQANTLTPELVTELAALERAAVQFFSTQQGYTKRITDVFFGIDLLTPESLVVVNNSMMIAHQMMANVERCMKDLREILPEGYRDDDLHFWNTCAGNLLHDTRNDFNQAVRLAKQISTWASLKIDGTSYQDQ